MGILFNWISWSCEFQVALPDIRGNLPEQLLIYVILQVNQPVQPTPRKAFLYKGTIVLT